MSAKRKRQSSKRTTMSKNELEKLIHKVLNECGIPRHNDDIEARLNEVIAKIGEFNSIKNGKDQQHSRLLQDLYDAIPRAISACPLSVSVKKLAEFWDEYYSKIKFGNLSQEKEIVDLKKENESLRESCLKLQSQLKDARSAIPSQFLEFDIPTAIRKLIEDYTHKPKDITGLRTSNDLISHLEGMAAYVSEQTNRDACAQAAKIIGELTDTIKNIKETLPENFRDELTIAQGVQILAAYYLQLRTECVQSSCRIKDLERRLLILGQAPD